MKVAIDARRMQDRPPGGVGRMLHNLVPRLAPAVQVELLTDARRPPIGGPWAEHPIRLPRGLPEPVWLQTGVTRWLRDFDGVFHGTFNALPFRLRVPGVVTFNDLAFEHHAEDFRRDKLAVWRAQARHAAKAAAAVVTISEFVRRGIVETYGVAADRIFVAPPSVDPVFAPLTTASDVGARLGVRAPYVVALGGARRRGLDTAVRAWEAVRAEGLQVDLVVVGPERVAERAGIINAGRLDDPVWAALLAGAEAFCYPTRYEGYGMPALEAMAAGTPVVCPRTGPLPDVVGDAAMWAGDAGVEAVAAALRTVLCEPELARVLRERGLARAAGAPTWGESAATLLEAYQTAAAS